MIDARSYQLGRLSANFEDYDSLFIPRVYRLIWLAYGRLNPETAAHDDETAVTGDLVEAIQILLDSPDEDWMRFYTSHDDPPENEPRREDAPRRRGRHRRRVDIRLESSETSPRTRFRFECKRLGRGHSARQYLGNEGLGCFLRGEYASQEPRAGMLGYVQSDDEVTWAMRLEQLITSGEGGYSLLAGQAWRYQPVIPELPHTYRSNHHRDQGTPPIEIYHTLLRFC